MTDIPSTKPAKLIRALLRLGFIERKSRGSHRFFRHPATKRITTVPVHPGELSPPFVKEIIKQSGVPIDEFLDKL